MKRIFLLPVLLFSLSGCQPELEEADAYGTFEAREVLVSAEVPGKILRLGIEEGVRLAAGEEVGLIDTLDHHLRKEQLLASVQAVRQKTQDAGPQIKVLKEQRQNLLREKRRIEALLKEEAATPKQLDDISGQIQVVEEQINRAEAQTQTANRGILAEIEPLRAQIRQVEATLRKCYLINPVGGTVLVQLAEPSEMTGAGQPLYKIADLSEMTLRVYVSGAQLPHIEIGQEVTVMVDLDEEKNQTFPGMVSWIANEAEFTPKIVQTKEERVNLVYAVKIRVPNDGTLKIGMPGEVLFEASGSRQQREKTETTAGQ